MNVGMFETMSYNCCNFFDFLIKTTKNQEKITKNQLTQAAGCQTKNDLPSFQIDLPLASVPVLLLTLHHMPKT